MSYNVITINPESSLTPSSIKAFRDQATLDIGNAAAAYGVGQVMVRGLRPADWYGSTSPISQFSNQVEVAANAEVHESGIARVPAATAFALIGYGIVASDPQFTELWVANGNTIVAQIRLVPLTIQGSARSAVGYFGQAILFGQNTAPGLVYVSKGDVVAYAEPYELIGLVASGDNSVSPQSALS